MTLIFYLLIFLSGFYGAKTIEFFFHIRLNLDFKIIGFILMLTSALVAIFYINVIHPIDMNLNDYEMARIKGYLMGEYVITPFVLALFILSVYWWYNKRVNYR